MNWVWNSTSIPLLLFSGSMFMAPSCFSSSSSVFVIVRLPHISFRLACWGGGALTDLGISKNFANKCIRKGVDAAISKVNLGFAGGPYECTERVKQTWVHSASRAVYVMTCFIASSILWCCMRRDECSAFKSMSGHLFIFFSATFLAQGFTFRSCSKLLCLKESHRLAGIIIVLLSELLTLE